MNLRQLTLGLLLLLPAAALCRGIVGAARGAADDAPGRKLHGLSFGPYVAGQSPEKGSLVTEKQIRDRLALLRGRTRWIRTYGSDQGLEKVPRIAKGMGFRVAAGAWVGAGQSDGARQRQLDALRKNVRAGWVDLAVVGSEVVRRGDIPAGDLVKLMKQFRKQIKAAVPVATADTNWVLRKQPMLMEASDVVLAHVYPYWDGVAADRAPAQLRRQYRALHRLAGKEVIVAETGWPSAGGSNQAARASADNAAAYFRAVLDWSEADRVKLFYFEAFDEGWKAGSEGGVGAHWGIFDQDGALKPGMVAGFKPPPARQERERHPSRP